MGRVPENRSLILKLKALCLSPVAENWTQTHLWESVALSVLGPDKWEKLWNGELSWKSPEVIKAWEMFGDILETLTLTLRPYPGRQATDMVVKGQAAFILWETGLRGT